MDILSDYRISSTTASDADLDLVAERVRRAYETLHEREAQQANHRQPHLGFLRRFRHA